jgi:formylglycine-generating enzyme required for sulfatase activity
MVSSTLSIDSIMPNIILFSLLLSLLLLPTSQAQQKLALVIGNASYSTISPLRNAINDAKDITNKLRQLGFNVVTLKRNVSHQQMQTAVRHFGKQIKAGDIALFYYAGHGVQSSDAQNYLIPLNANIQDESDLQYKAINASWVLSNLQLSKPALKIMILDACRDNPFRSLRSWRGSASRGLARMSSRGGTIIAYAADEGQKASDGRGSNGLYTQELLKLLGKKGIQASQMFSNVSWNVSNDPSGKGQTPYLSMKAPPPFCFAGCKAPLPPQPVVIKPKPQNNSTAIVHTPPPAPRLRFEPEMIAIKGGAFTIGSPSSEKGHYKDEKQRSVTLEDFWMGKTEVTFAQWQACVDDGGCQDNKKPDDNGWGLGDRPVINVSWHDANDYANWLSNKTGKHYRLPTEAQWEVAARGKSRSRFHFGDNDAQLCDYGNHADKSVDYDWRNKRCSDGVGKKTATVAQYKANPYGLYDMIGNVREWTCSAYTDNYDGSENKCAKRNEKRSRVLRGGSWFSLPGSLRSAYRHYYYATSRYYTVGFRLSRTR